MSGGVRQMKEMKTMTTLRNASVGALLVTALAAPARPARITEFDVPTAASFPGGIASGPDGRIWFCEISGNKIGAITTGGETTEYPISAGCKGITPAGGLLYYTEPTVHRVGAMATGG